MTRNMNPIEKAVVVGGGGRWQAKESGSSMQHVALGVIKGAWWRGLGIKPAKPYMPD